jgi:hypothetical protein
MANDLFGSLSTQDDQHSNVPPPSKKSEEEEIWSFEK